MGIGGLGTCGRSFPGKGHRLPRASGLTLRLLVESWELWGGVPDSLIITRSLASSDRRESTQNEESSASSAPAELSIYCGQWIGVI